MESIDLTQYTVFYGTGCKAIFERGSSFKPRGWVGPADALEFRETICPAD